MTAVAHLVWGPLGPEPLRAFLDSYRAHPANDDHELAIVLNGVSGEQRGPLLDLLDGIEHRLIQLEQPVQDLRAYAEAAGRLQEHERLCFMNSYATILADGWLAKLSRALDERDVGLVGASGSWASMRSWALYAHRLPSAYRHVVPERRQAFAQFGQINADLDSERTRGHPHPTTPDSQAAPGRARALAERIVSTVEQMTRFPGFPAPHLRTNAFLIEAELLRSLKVGGLRRKMDAYSLESGNRSITAQALRAGADALVVDAEGTTYEVSRWPASHTFWQAGQERLLVADNQSRTYARGGLERRRLLSAMAWGAEAAPVSDGEFER